MLGQKGLPVSLVTQFGDLCFLTVYMVSNFLFYDSLGLGSYQFDKMELQTILLKEEVAFLDCLRTLKVGYCQNRAVTSLFMAIPAM